MQTRRRDQRSIPTNPEGRRIRAGAPATAATRSESHDEGHEHAPADLARPVSDAHVPAAVPTAKRSRRSSRGSATSAASPQHSWRPHKRSSRS